MLWSQTQSLRLILAAAALLGVVSQSGGSGPSGRVEVDAARLNPAYARR